MEREARAYVEQGGAGAELSVRRHAYMRYQGQGHEIAVEVPMTPLDDTAPSMLQALFDAEYRKVFGRDIGALAAGEIVSWSLTVSSPPHADRTPVAASAMGEAETGWRPVFDASDQAMTTYAVVIRNELGASQQLEGPVIITEDETSIIVSSTFDARVLPGGEVELMRKPRPADRKGALYERARHSAQATDLEPPDRRDRGTGANSDPHGLQSVGA